jgi:hypothetical protein
MELISDLISTRSSLHSHFAVVGCGVPVVRSGARHAFRVPEL